MHDAATCRSFCNAREMPSFCMPSNLSGCSLSITHTGRQRPPACSSSQYAYRPASHTRRCGPPRPAHPSRSLRVDSADGEVSSRVGGARLSVHSASTLASLPRANDWIPSVTSCSNSVGTNASARSGGRQPQEGHPQGSIHQSASASGSTSGCRGAHASVRPCHSLNSSNQTKRSEGRS